jgi:hypothetical protein
MGPCSDNQSGWNRRHPAFRTEFGFVQKSRQIKDLERVQARNVDLRPDLRLNWVLLPRTPGCASDYSMIRKSENRFSEKIMPNKKIRQSLFQRS